MFGDPVPQVVVIRVAVNGQDGRPLRVDLGVGVDGQRDAVRGGHANCGWARRNYSPKLWSSDPLSSVRGAGRGRDGEIVHRPLDPAQL